MQIIHAPMSNDQLPTPEQVAAALASTAAERAVLGLDSEPITVPPIAVLQFIQDRPVLHGGIPREVREQCGEAIDAAVETWGLAAVIRAVKSVAAVNGVAL